MADHPDYPRRVACLRSCEDHNVHLCMTAPTLWNNRGLKLWWNKMSNERSGYARRSFFAFLVEKRLVAGNSAAADQVASSHRGHLVESSEATGG